MTLRVRLLFASAVIVATVLAGAVTILRSQESHLIDQVDAQLVASQPFLGRGPIRPDVGVQPEPPERPADLAEADDGPVSQLYVAVIADDQVTTVLRGQLLGDVPDVPGDIAGALDGGETAVMTLSGVTSSTRFRVAVAPIDGTEAVTVAALPLDEVDESIDKLRTALGVMSATIVVVLGLAIWWLHRLGLRPVAKVTEVADDISRGERHRRVTGTRPNTEAGRLAAAFNTMLDEQHASEERLRQFVSDASHELRTPLTSIRGYLDLYAEGGFRKDGQLDDMIRRMSQESARMGDLVEDLLTLAKFDEHRPLRTEQVDVRELLDNAAVDARATQPERSIVVEGDAGPIVVAGDTFRLQQVVTILVDNALHHTPRSAAIRLGAHRRGDDLTAWVADAGPGMPREQADRVFDRFFRGDSGRTRSRGGSGLGLAIAKSIVDAHHGTIEVHTGEGQGCTFVVTVPVGADDAGASADEA